MELPRVLPEHWAGDMVKLPRWKLVTVGFLWSTSWLPLFPQGLVAGVFKAVGSENRSWFLALYLLSLLAGSAVVLWAAPEYQLTLGASGAIYGLFAALLVVARRVGADMRQLWVLIGINVFITFAVPNISWQGHLGGFVGGAVVAGVLAYAPRGPRRPLFQAGGLLLVAILIALAIVVRTAALA